MRKTFLTVYKDRHEGLGVYEFTTLLEQAIEWENDLNVGQEKDFLVAHLEIHEDGRIIRHKDLRVSASSIEEET